MSSEIAPSAPGIASNPEEDGDRDGLIGRLVGIRELKAGFRRRRRFLVAAAVAGLVLGAALHVVVPRSYKAVSNLYLVEPPGAIPADAMANEVSLLQTKAVARQAASFLPGHPDAETVATSYKGQAVSGSILSVSATGSSPEKAVALNTAVAKAFLAVRSEELQREANVVVAELQSQIGALKGDPDSVQLQRSQLLSNELSAQLASRSSVNGSFVLDPAETVKVSTKKVIIVDTLSGLVAGLGLGAGIVVTREILSDRAWRREDVAADLGVPVELSLGRQGRRRLRAGRGRTGSAGERRAAMVERRLRTHVDAISNRSLAIFGVEDEGLAAGAVCSLASALALEGETVFVVDLAEGHPIAEHFALPGGDDQVQRVQLDSCSLNVLVAPGHPPGGFDPIVRSGTDYVLVLADVDPAFGVEHVGAWASEGVVIVTAGKATHFRLVGIGRMIRRAGIALRSAVLLGADPSDDSVGFVESDSTQPQGSPAINVLPVG